jgi:DNA-binding Lrp family transcriptional regulator
MAPSMDLLDRKILFELDCDSRRSLSELSRKVHLGRDLVSYRIGKLKESGILNKCTLMINPYKLGFTEYKTYLKLETDKDRWAQFVAHLDAHPSTSWLAECYGRWDVVWSVFARSPKEVYDLQDRLFSEFSDIIIGYNVCTLVNSWWFPKKYLLGRSVEEVQGWQFKPPVFTVGATPLAHQVDEVECGILRLLSEDAQMSCTEMAEVLRISPAVVKYRTEKLEKMGVIAGYRVALDRKALGRTLFTVQVAPRDFDARKERELHDYLLIHPQISAYTQQLGDFKLEFEVEAKDYQEFGAVIEEVREQFSRYLRSLDYLMIKKDYFHRAPCGLLDGLRPYCQTLPEAPYVNMLEECLNA